MIKAILFDFGGVIYQNPKKVIPKALSLIYNQPVETTNKEYKKYKEEYFTGKLKTDDLIKFLSSKFKTKKSVDDIKKLWLKYYGEMAQANNEILKLIKRLRGKYKIYLFSDTTEMSNKHNSQSGIYDYFDGLFFSYQTGFTKPDVKAYKNILRKTELKPDECLLIDDKEENLKAARKLGITTILFDVLKHKPIFLKGKLRKLNIR